MTGLSGTAPSMNAGELVNDAWASWKRDASDLASSATGFLTDLSSISVSPVSTAGISYTVPAPSFASSSDFGEIPSSGEITQQVFSIPNPPDIDVVVAEILQSPEGLAVAPDLLSRDPGLFTQSAPSGASVGAIGQVVPPTLNLNEAVAFSGAAPGVANPDTGSPPDSPDVQYVTPAPFTAVKPNTDTDITYPDAVTAPTLTYPDAPEDGTGSPPPAPTFNAPTAPEISLPTWEGVAPVNNISVPSVGVDFTPVDYESTNLTEIQDAVSELLLGTGGIPSQIWDSMFNKARADEERIGAAEIEAAFDEWGARGFDLQSGIIDRNLREIRTNVSLKSTALIQGMRSEQAKSELDNLRFAVQQGITLEAQLMGLFDKSQNRLLAIQELEIKAAVDIFGMQVGLFNSQLEAYKAEASVFKDRVQAALADIEVFKAKIDAEKLKLEAGKIEAEIYEITVKAYGEKVGAYKTAIEAIESRVDAYRAEVEARKYHLEGERLKLGIAENKIKIYATEVDAYKALTQAANISNDTNRIKADVYKAEVDGYRAGIESAKVDLGAIDARIKVYQSEVDAHKANTQAVSVTNDANKYYVDVYQADIANRNASVAAERLKLDEVSNAIASYQAAIEGYKANVAGVSAYNDINSSRASVYKAAVDGYSARVQAYKASTDAQISIADQKNKANEYVNTRYAAQIDGIKAQIQQETGRLQQMISFFDSKSRVHKANAEITQGEASTNITSWQAVASVAADNAKLAAEKAKVDLEQILRIAEIESANARTAAQVYGQVGAATLAGVSMSAGLSQRTDWSNQYSFNESHGYKYDCETGNCQG